MHQPIHGEKMRLDKFISSNSLFTRSDVRKLIKSKRIEINNRLATNASQTIESVDQVFVDGKHLEPVGQIYLMLNKPKGYVCATFDSEHPTVIDLVRNFAENSTNPKYKRILLSDLQIVGRLDLDTTGLVLLTNDGDWNHKITSPNSQCKKTYFVTLAEDVSEATQEKFINGIQLEGEKKKTLPARIELITRTKARVTITEGKYHQIKRMFGATGNKVISLHREKVGNITLGNKLQQGECRLLESDEINSIESADPLVIHSQA